MRAPDQDVRDRIVAARGVNLAVEAGAGTGKTTLLVERVVDLVRGGTPLSRLAVITFTRKAAADLEARLLRRLAEAREAGAPWAATALDDLPAADLGTTDSFCRTILADFALEAGAPPGFALAAEIAEDALRESAWARFLARGSEADARRLERLRELGVKTAGLRQVADALLDHRDLPVAGGGAEAPAELVDVYAGALAPALALRERCNDPGDRLLLRLDELARDLAVARSVGGIAGERVLLAIPRRGRGSRSYAIRQGRKSSWGGDAVKGEVVAALERLDEAVAAWRRARGVERAADVARWLDGYAAEYAALKRERGLVDFRDLALAVRDLLRSDADARRRIASRWDAILIDEAQDTDPLQMEIAILLAAREPVPPDPFEAALEPGRLFLVGDPKQSIYRFRRADLSLYARTRAVVEAGEAGPAIRANFRSHPSLIDFVNRLFTGWMEPSPGETYQASYVELLAGREAPGGPGGPRVELVLPDPALRAAQLRRSGATRPSAEDRAELERDAVVRAILRGLGRDGAPPAWRVVDPATGKERAARPGDVAVLVRRMTGGERLLDALRRAGIAATSFGGRGFHAREEIQTLLALLEAVVRPDDPRALFAALRSPALAVSDDDLVLRFTEEDGARAGVSPGAREAEARLRALGEEARGLSAADFLERLVEEVALLPAFGFRPDGRSRIESLRLLVEAAAPLADAGFDSLPELVRWLARRSADEPLALGEIEPSGEDAVSLLTIHKAKGLEFPIVVLADLGGKGASPSPVVPDRPAGRLEFRLPGAPEVATAGHEEAESREKARRDAEELRLLYVAVTRARDRLLLVWTEGRDGFLGMLPDRLGVAAGAAPPEELGLGVVRAGDLPPLAGTARVHVREVAEPRRRVAAEPGDLFAPPSLRPQGSPPRSSLLPVTTIAEGAYLLPDRADATNRSELYGKEFGSFVHVLLEELEPGPDEDGAFAGAAAAAFRRVRPPDAGETRAAWIARAQRFVRDPAVTAILGRIARDPRRAQREVPFVIPAGDDLLAGTLDLLLENPDGSLTVLDYKTERLGPGGAAAAARRHRVQAGLYAWALARAAGRAVREVELLFLDPEPAETVRLAVDEELLATARAALESAEVRARARGAEEALA
jgi:ATP-dependent helicase/nuclease subunit A